jgi:hypothetical protein
MAEHRASAMCIRDNGYVCIRMFNEWMNESINKTATTNIKFYKRRLNKLKCVDWMHFWDSTYFFLVFIVLFSTGNSNMSHLNPLWLGFTGDASLSIITWLDSGLAVSSVVNASTGSNLCGSVNMNSGNLFLRDCNETRAFVCVKTNGGSISALSLYL